MFDKFGEFNSVEELNMAAAGQKERLMEALKIGAKLFITKPFNEEEVLNSLSDLENLVIELGYKKFNAGQIFDWLYKKRIDSFDQMSNVKKELIEYLNSSYELGSIEVIDQKKDKDVAKFLSKMLLIGSFRDENSSNDEIVEEIDEINNLKEND